MSLLNCTRYVGIYGNKKNYLKTIVGPTTKLHKAILVIKREPCDVDFTRTFENTRRNVQARTVMSDYHIRLISTIEFFVSTVSVKIHTHTYIKFNNWALVVKKIKEYISLFNTNKET